MKRDAETRLKLGSWDAGSWDAGSWGMTMGMAIGVMRWGDEMGMGMRVDLGNMSMRWGMRNKNEGWEGRRG